MSRKSRLTLAILTAGLTASSAAFATETITYTYDARGRLVKVVHEPTSSVNANVQTIYTLDKAGNRTNVTTTGAP